MCVAESTVKGERYILFFISIFYSGSFMLYFIYFSLNLKFKTYQNIMQKIPLLQRWPVTCYSDDVVKKKPIISH